MLFPRGDTERVIHKIFPYLLIKDEGEAQEGVAALSLSCDQFDPVSDFLL